MALQQNPKANFSLIVLISLINGKIESFCVDSRGAKCIGTDSLSVTKDTDPLCS